MTTVCSASPTSGPSPPVTFSLSGERDFLESANKLSPTDERDFLESAKKSSPSRSSSSSSLHSASSDDKPHQDFYSLSLNLNHRLHDPLSTTTEVDDDEEMVPLGAMRPRTYSLPATEVRSFRPVAEPPSVWRDVYTCPVRSFSRTTKGVVNRGDSVRKCSINSLLSSGSTMTEGEERHRALSIASQDGVGFELCGGVGVDGNVAPPYFRVAILGTMGVGKSALFRQFMSSEYLGTYETNCGEFHFFLSSCFSSVRLSVMSRRSSIVHSFFYLCHPSFIRWSHCDVTFLLSW